jgi:NAD(P)-dependent dehydrogenase (short-subunit alcohol dehydrogenase family)
MDGRRTVLVAGAAGGVGEGIVRQLLLRNPDVLVVGTSRSQARLAALCERLGPVDFSRFVPMVGDAGTRAGARALDDRIAAQIGPLDVAVPSLGGWWEGALLEVLDEEWEVVMHEMLGTHAAFAHVFVPRLAARPGGLYLAIGGGAALTPIPGSSLVSIAGAAQTMLTRALALEAAERDVRIVELIANGPVRTYETPPDDATASWLTADDIGAVVADLVAGRPPQWPNLRERGPVITMDPRDEESATAR